MSAVMEQTDIGLGAGDAVAVQRILLEGVRWERYERLLACFPDSRAPRLTFVDGSLEIRSPVGPDQERWKATLCLLLEAYLDAQVIRFYSRGGFTLKQRGLAGGEPDASYCFGADKSVPDLMIEVVDTSDALSKLPLYGALGVAEVSLWRRAALDVQVLEPSEGDYRPTAASRLLPRLNLQLLATHVRMPDQYDAVQAFRRALADA